MTFSRGGGTAKRGTFEAPLIMKPAAIWIK
jgi:hypothetical protein